MAWVHEAGFCTEAVRDKEWTGYANRVNAGEESVEEWEEIKAAVAAFTSSRTKSELLRGAVERRLLMAPICDLADVLGSEHLAARDFWVSTSDGTGREIAAPGRYARFSDWTPAPLSEVPRPGQDSDATSAEGRAPASPPPGATRPAALPLAGLKVLDLTWSVAGPAMTRTLADYGATVVKIESRRRIDGARTFFPLWSSEAGVEHSALFDNLNAGKHSVALNIATDRGRAVLDDLIRWADVVVDSFSPRGRKTVGLDDARVRALNPTIINFSVSLFGLHGPLAELAGYGNLGAAMSGCYELTGWPDRAPAGPYLAYTDYTSAHLMVVSVVAALLHRAQGGAGQFIELSQTETALQFLAPALVATAATGTTFTRIGNDDLSMAPHGVFPCAGAEQWVAIACQDDARWPALCQVIGRPDLAADPTLRAAAGRRDDASRLHDAVAAWTTSRAPGDVEARCQALGIAAYTVQNSAECVADPQFAHRGHIVRLEHPRRDCVVEATRCQLSRTPGRPQRHGPILGEHTNAVLTGCLGYDGQFVADLGAADILE
jgi:crotonobetainyl-CoA:carnitine CoA-transferase CaiB-like acyl-CoA transferase